MRTIRNIAIHHSGGTAADGQASSRHITFEDINALHKKKWNFESHIFKGTYVGYNFVYDPKNRSFIQARGIGEETAAQIGHNFDTISICIIGNYSRRGNTSFPVDPMTTQMKEDVTKFVLALINVKFSPGQVMLMLTTGHTVKVFPDTMIDLNITRVHPHRYYQPGTECYGTALSDSWIYDLIAGNTTDQAGNLQKRVNILKALISLYMRLNALKDKAKVVGRGIGANDVRAYCNGFDAL